MFSGKVLSALHKLNNTGSTAPKSEPASSLVFRGGLTELSWITRRRRKIARRLREKDQKPLRPIGNWHPAISFTR